jgi:hypothetical protein
MFRTQKSQSTWNMYGLEDYSCTRKEEGATWVWPAIDHFTEVVSWLVGNILKPNCIATVGLFHKSLIPGVRIRLVLQLPHPPPPKQR